METENPLLESPRFPQHITSLRETLQKQNEDVSQAYLMGVSGEAFRFFYSRLDPLKGHRVFLQNPLRSACSALGYKYKVYYDEDPEHARRRLEGHLKRKQDVIIETDNDWPLIRYAYHPGKVMALNGKHEEMPLESLMRRWNPIDGLFELGPTGYYQFVVEKQDRKPNEQDAALGALRRAVKMLKGERRIQGCAMGLAAFEELRSHLMQLGKAKTLTITQIERIVAWGKEPFTQLVQSRRYALEYLQIIREHFEGDALEQIDRAIEVYQQAQQYYQAFGENFPRMPERIEFEKDPRLPGKVKLRSVSAFRKACRRASRWLGKIIKAETQAADAFHQVIRIVERTRM